ncbi:aspartate/glutamate racemase family protein [Georgenia yuyongxinii]|uniref:Asp/Glu racemase n=1 Tax=Georgenia yuyongxinii TaxID=2589797 RepID=A0A552WKE9_9MICO|nr:aspartate/glutamate racemase family protein [Georgenia yuyongxinii]TRW43149.1 Asp/Glu racemase [Georgenia yuyongxinii]
MKIGMLHATPLAQAPAARACREILPDAEQWHLLDERLLPDLKEDGALTPRLRRRFLRLLDVLLDGGADGVLVTCSSYSELADVAERYWDAPVVKPDAEMFRAVALSEPPALALVASTSTAFAPAEAQLAARPGTARTVIHRVLIDPAAGESGEVLAQAMHAPVTAALDQGSTAVVLAQYSLGAAATPLSNRLGVPVHEGAGAAAEELRRRLGHVVPTEPPMTRTAKEA